MMMCLRDLGVSRSRGVKCEEILSKYPIKATKNVCDTCGGRGVVVCDNCQGSGIQPRFLERYSPDDFMD